ncbi:MAG: hypothetical protein ACRYFZ_00990 [Janthinobacterium lividum]
MFPLVGILVAVGLLLKQKHKSAAPAASTAKSTNATVSSQPNTATSSAKPVTVIKPKAAATVKPRAATSTIEGYVTPGINAQVNDLLGQWGNTNPKVLNQTLPIGQYNPATNSTGYQTPPIVQQPTYSRY